MIIGCAAYKVNISTMFETAFQYYYDDQLPSYAFLFSDFDIKPYTFYKYITYGENYFEMKSTWEAPYKFNAKDLTERSHLPKFSI